MKQKSLRSILGGSHRITKKKEVVAKRTLSLNKPTSHSTKSQNHDNEDDDDDDNDDNDAAPLPNHGVVHSLVTDPTLRDIPQAMRYATAHMFTPLPANPAAWGLHSTQVATVLQRRTALPPLTTIAHLHAFLRRRSPAAVEREADELVRAGAVRKVVLWRRGGVVEVLVESGRLEDLVCDTVSMGSLGVATKEGFVAWLRAHPAQLTMGPDKEAALTAPQIDELVRAGFLTTYHDDCELGRVSSRFAQVEGGDGLRGSSISLQSVARAAAGSVDAAGGREGFHGQEPQQPQQQQQQQRQTGRGTTTEVTLAVPGQGTYLKLLGEAVEHMADVVRKQGSAWGEMPLETLREMWDGVGAVKRHVRRGSGVLPGKTKKWKAFWGLDFEWVLCEAVGMGAVEVFETGSVGRAVRLL